MTGTVCEHELQANLPALCTATHKDTLTCAHTCTYCTTHTHTLAQIPGRRSPQGQTSKARAQGINRKQSQVDGFQILNLEGNLGIFTFSLFFHFPCHFSLFCPAFFLWFHLLISFSFSATPVSPSLTVYMHMVLLEDNRVGRKS